MSDRIDIPNFTSAEDLAELLMGLSGRLHAKNRIALGESGFVWEMAELLRRAGVTFRDRLNDPVVRQAFGDGYTRGELPEKERPAALFALMYPADDRGAKS